MDILEVVLVGEVVGEVVGGQITAGSDDAVVRRVDVAALTIGRECRR